MTKPLIQLSACILLSMMGMHGWSLDALPIVDVAGKESDTRFSPSDQALGQVTVSPSSTPPGVVLAIAPGGSSYPGVTVKPEQGFWDLSAYGHVEAKVTNLGTEKITLILKLDDDSDGGQTSNSDKTSIKPGETRTCKTLFGYSWGAPAASINSRRVVSITLYTSKITAAPGLIRIESLDAAGPAGEKLPVDPNLVATTPPAGVIFGPGITIEAKQLVAKSGARAAMAADGTGMDLTFSAPGQSVTVRPPAGTWRLNQHLDVRVLIANTGSASVVPRVRLESKPGPSAQITAAAPLAPGADVEVIVPFRADVPWRGLVTAEQNQLEGKKTWGGEPGTGTLYASCFTDGVTVSVDGPGNLRIRSIIAGMPKPNLPDWLGTRPPVDGDWGRTFSEEFSGDTIDLKTWNIYTEGEWHLGKQTHYTKDNVIVKDGTLTLRVEKKPGHHNDDPKMERNDYATGYADTYGKWTQRYGYFEVRMKLPTAPSMFSAFWMMPDRGIATPANAWGRKSARTSTKDGGMEFDIMETLSLWGPWRHDFGMHWDDYMKYHKSNGVYTCYSPPDQEGFITVGMLWTPGLVVMYDGGVEAARWESPRIGSVQEYFILDNITGGWESEPLDDSKLPGDFVIDYIRAWQRKDLASPGDGPKPNLGGPYPPTEDPAASPGP